MARVWNGAQLRAKAFQCRGRDIGAEIRRQLAVGCRLDEREHVGRTAPEEVPGDELRRDRNADACKLVRSDRCRDRFAIDQHSVAIEDEHETPR
jgi:hypothetical protein